MLKLKPDRDSPNLLLFEGGLLPYQLSLVPRFMCWGPWANWWAATFIHGNLLGRKEITMRVFLFFARPEFASICDWTREGLISP
jgi:hypothetical protein